MKKIISFLIAAVMIISVGITAFAQNEKTDIDGSNWMSALDSNQLITSINIPGTHDSASKNAMPFNALSSTQNKTIAQQLYSGVRYLDIRLELTKKGDINVIHEISDCKDSMGLTSKTLKIEDITNICIDFLKKNTGETIFLHIRQDRGEKTTQLYDTFYNKCVVGNENYWYLINNKPTLKDVRGKIVLLRGVPVDSLCFNDTNSGINFMSYPYVGSTQLDNFKFCPITKLENGGIYDYMYVQDSYKLNANDKKSTIKSFLQTYKLSSDYNICATNCIGSGSPHFCAEIVNKWFMEYSLEDGAVYGIISMDFITDELCEKIYLTNSFVNNANDATENTEVITYSLFGKALEFMRNIIQNIESCFA